MKVRFSKETFTPLRDGRYHVRLNSVREGQGRFGSAYIFEFEVISGPYRGCRVEGLVNKCEKYGVRQKLWRWVAALSKTPPSIGDEINLNALIEKICWAEIEWTRSTRGAPSNRIVDLHKEDTNGSQHS